MLTAIHFRLFLSCHKTGGNINIKTNKKNHELSSVLYSCETWSLRFREEYGEGICEQGAEENIEI
jgi:hypothetical protein